MIKKTILFFVFGSIVSLYTTFVVQTLWNWFATAAFHIPEISFWSVYGLVLLLSLLTDSAGQFSQEESRWKIAMIVLDACVPAEKREELKSELEYETQSQWAEAGFAVLGRVIGNTFAIFLGWGVHTFLA